MYKFTCVFVVISIVTAADPPSLPANFPICSRSRPDLDSCVKSAIQTSLPILKPGLKYLGVPTIDPLHLSHLAIDQGTGPVAINLDFTNIEIYGISSARVLSVSTNVAGDTATLKVTASIVDPLIMRGRYTIKGNVLVLPISGAGRSEIELHGTNVVIEFTGKEIPRNGEKHLIWDTIKFAADPKLMKLNFENLFNGDAVLGDNMNKFLNDNWRQVYDELQAPIQESFARTILQLVNIIFSKIPSRILFP